MIVPYLSTSVSKGTAALASSGSEGGFPNNRNREAPDGMSVFKKRQRN
jgi:hypothetical protein